MAVHLDLVRDLPKLQRALPKLLENLGGVCEYAQPCAVGVMVNPKKRRWLDKAPFDDTQIDTLIHSGMVKVPQGQGDDLRSLQRLFDQSDAHGLDYLVQRLAAKYLRDTDGAVGIAEKDGAS